MIFLRKGKLVEASEVMKWIKMMGENDAKAGKRLAPRKQKLEAELNELSPHLLGDDVITDQLGLKLVIKANTLVRMAKMKAKGVLVPYLNDKCQPRSTSACSPRAWQCSTKGCWKRRMNGTAPSSTRPWAG